MSGTDRLNIVYDTCIVELCELMNSIVNYERKCTQILVNMRKIRYDINAKNEPHNVDILEKFCSNVIDITNLAKEFSLAFQIRNLDLVDSTTINGEAVNGSAKYVDNRATIKQTINSMGFNNYAHNGNSIKEESQETVTNGQNGFSTSENEEENHALDDPPNEQSISPSYEQKDLSVYCKNQVITATVTYIENLDHLQFFLYDAESDDVAKGKLAQLAKMKHLVQYGHSSLPAKNEVFGLVLDDVIVRAVCLGKKDKEILVQLLDLGETLQIGAQNIMYYLSFEYKKIPAQAIPCVLRVDRSVDKSYLRTLLECWEYQKLKFRVVENDGHTLHVRSLVHEDANDCAANSLYSSLAPTNPFRDDVLNAIEEEEEYTIPPSLEATALFNGACNKAGMNGLTPEELEEFYEETPCTSNAMKAVMGYVPKDDERICRFYNPKTGSCFKGSTCRQEHTLMLKDGWTKDVLPACSIIDVRAPDIIYSPGTLLSITPTCITNLENFYCQVNDPKVNTEPIIFTDEDVVDMGGTLNSPPMVFDLVLCRYQDGFWYRAKIMDSDEDAKLFRVFYVDYGNEEVVHLRNLAKCDSGISQWPFQAVLCCLADVKKVPLLQKQKKEGLDFMRNCILNQPIDVRVVFHREELLVRIIDEKSKNLVTTLIQMGCLKPFK